MVVVVEAVLVEAVVVEAVVVEAVLVEAVVVVVAAVSCPPPPRLCGIAPSAARSVPTGVTDGGPLFAPLPL